MYTIYLSSTSYHWWNFKSKFWKSKFIDKIYKLGKYKNDIGFIDPLIFKSEDPKVCPLDIRDINNSQLVVVYLDKITIGTLLELGYCIFYRKKDWFIYTTNKNVVNHPWISFLCKDNIFTDMDELVLKVVNLFKTYRNKRSYGYG